MNSQPYKEAFHNVQLLNMEWKLRIMTLMGKLKCGFGVYLLYLGQNRIL